MRVTQTPPKKLSGKDAIHLHDIDFNLNLMYRLSQEVYRRKIFKKFDGKPFFPFKAVAILIGSVQARSQFNKLYRIWTILYPNKQYVEKNYKKWARRLMAYIIEFFFEVTFYLPNQSGMNVKKFIKLEGEKHLKSALKEGHGVLAPSLHLGHFLHAGAILRFQTFENNGHAELLKLSMIGTPENEFLLREQLQDYPNVFPILTGPAQNLKEVISRHLNANHIVFLMQDYCNQHQLRVPFIYGKINFQFLVPTPQMMASKHFLHGSPIIPILTIPGKDLRYSRVIIFPNQDPMSLDPMAENSIVLRQEIVKYQENKLTNKQKRGLISLLVNRIIYPYILKYPHYWEEVFSFGYRNKFEFTLDITGNGGNLIKNLCQNTIKFLTHSYEPGRNDEGLIVLFQKIEKITSEVAPFWSIPEGIPHQIDCGLKTGSLVVDEILSVMRVLVGHLTTSEKNNLNAVFLEIQQKFHRKLV